ncbi:MAG: hypothetical protein JXR77_15635 [Lentisphaeria bacterium]|nr:hypothetical protein [Lentisphaeria bacterium]
MERKQWMVWASGFFFAWIVAAADAPPKAAADGAKADAAAGTPAATAQTPKAEAAATTAPAPGVASGVQPVRRAPTPLPAIDPDRRQKAQELQSLRREYALARRSLMEKERALSAADEQVQQKLAAIEQKITGLREQIARLEAGKADVYSEAKPELAADYTKVAELLERIQGLQAELYPPRQPTPLPMPPQPPRAPGHAVPGDPPPNAPQAGAAKGVNGTPAAPAPQTPRP